MRTPVIRLTLEEWARFPSEERLRVANHWYAWLYDSVQGPDGEVELGSRVLHRVEIVDEVGARTEPARARDLFDGDATAPAPE